MSKDQKRGLIVVFVVLAILVIGLIVAITQFHRVSTTGSRSSYPPSTLSDTQGFSSFQPSSLLPLVLQCPSVPYEVCVPDGSAVEDGVVYGAESSGGVTVAIEEVDNSVPTPQVLAGSISTAGNTYVQVPSAVWSPMIEDRGYINGYEAEYGAGFLTLEQKVGDDIQFGVYYRISFPMSRTNLMIYVYSDSLENIDNAKTLADNVVYTLRSLDSAGQTEQSDEATAEGVSSTEERGASEEGTEASVEVSEEEKKLNEIDEFMNSMTIVENGSVKGESWPHYTDLNDLHLEKDYVKMDDEDIDSYVLVRDFEFEPGAGRDVEFIFVWEAGYNNTSPSVVTVTDSNNRHYEDYDSEFTSIKDGVIAIRVPETNDGKYYLHYVVGSDIGNPDSYVWLAEEIKDRLDEYGGDFESLKSDIMNHRHDDALWDE